MVKCPYCRERPFPIAKLFRRKQQHKFTVCSNCGAYLLFNSSPGCGCCLAVPLFWGFIGTAIVKGDYFIREFFGGNARLYFLSCILISLLLSGGIFLLSVLSTGVRKTDFRPKELSDYDQILE